MSIHKVQFDKNALLRDAQRYMETFAYNYAKEASNQLTKKAKSCIEMFYNDYTPRYYKRTDDLRDNSIQSYFHNNTREYRGGVRISPEKMSPYNVDYNAVSTDAITVAQLGWHGFHGDPLGYGKFKPIWTTSPLSVLRRFYESDKFNNDIENYAYKKAAEQNYEIIKLT